MNRSESYLQHTRITAIFLVVLMVLMAIPVGIVGAVDKQPVLIEQGPPQVNSEYRLSKYDQINIVIVGFSGGDGGGDMLTSGIPRSIIIGPDGNVNLPYIGSIKLAGLTIPEATLLLTGRLGEYLKIPSLSIIVTEYGTRKIYVMGEVNKPGIYTLGSEYMNVFAAISSAGGITKRGRPKHISVVRIVEGKVQMQKVNFDRFVEKQDAAQNAKLHDGDMVYVPRSNRIDINEDIMPLINLYFIYKALK